MSAFRHERGVHCGSTALRNVFAASGLLLSEPLVFGLGAGLGFSLHDGARGLVPPLPQRFFVGRSLAYEEELCRALGVRLTVLRFDSPAALLDDARARLAHGQTPLVFTDLFHLPYLGARGHWFGHLVALAAIDGERALVSDNEQDSLEPVPLESLKLALCGASAEPTQERVLLAIDGIHAISGEVLREAARGAIASQASHLRASRMPPLEVWRGEPGSSGLAALRELPDELRSWVGAPDLARRLRFAGQVIELRGNGGGLFRRLYAAFLRDAVSLGLEEAAPLLPLCLRDADAFTALADEFARLHARSSRGDLLDDRDLEPAARLASAIVEAETALVSALGASAPA